MAGRIWARGGPAGVTRAALCWDFRRRGARRGRRRRLRWKFRASPWRIARNSTTWPRELRTRLRAGPRRFARPTCCRRTRESTHDAALALVVSWGAVPGRRGRGDLLADFAAQHPASGKVATAQRRAGAAGIYAAPGNQSKRSARKGAIILGGRPGRRNAVGGGRG